MCLGHSLPDNPEVIKHSSSLKLHQKITKVTNWSFRALDSFSFVLFSRNPAIFDFPLWSLQPFVLAIEHNNLLLNNGEKNLELFRSKGLFALLQCELMTQIWSVLLASSSLLILFLFTSAVITFTMFIVCLCFMHSCDFQELISPLLDTVWLSISMIESRICSIDHRHALHSLISFATFNYKTLVPIQPRWLPPGQLAMPTHDSNTWFSADPLWIDVWLL